MPEKQNSEQIILLCGHALCQNNIIQSILKLNANVYSMISAIENSRVTMNIEKELFINLVDQNSAMSIYNEAESKTCGEVNTVNKNSWFEYTVDRLCAT